MGYFEAGDSYGEMSEMIAFGHEHNIKTNMSITQDGTSALEYFVHNFMIDIITILGGILFSIYSVWNVLSSSFIAGHYIGHYNSFISNLKFIYYNNIYSNNL